MSGRPEVPRRLDERISGISMLLVVADILSVIVGALLFDLSLTATLALMAMLVTCRASARVYRKRLRLSYTDDFPRAAASVIAAFGISLGIFLFFNDTGPKDPDVLYAVLVFIGLSELQRLLVFAVCSLARRRLGRGDRALIVGIDPVGIDLGRNMNEHPEFGLRLVGMAELTTAEHDCELPAPLLRGDLCTTICEQRVGTVVLANPDASRLETIEATITANSLGCQILILPRLHELYRDSPEVERLRGYPLVRLNTDPTRRVSWWIKRLADVVGATLALLFLAPVIAACMLAILVESGRPVIFAQDRVGIGGARFRIYKLRSMKPADDTESQTRWNIAGDPRVGPVGRMLRRTSLDELPQLWNIVRGDMSVVGPRPERPEFVAEFTERHEGYRDRHRVPTGLTGLAQVNGLRGDTSIADRARYDNYYIANWSLWLDAKIILFTLRELVRRGVH